MRELGHISRRLFGQSLGATAALTFLSKAGFAASATIEVRIDKFAFQPGSMTIKRGDTVRWTNMDAAPHTATSADGNWDTGGLGKQETASMAFQRSGIYPYFCAFHPHMKGQILVVD